MSADKDSKTEDPTAKKLSEARSEGQIARSQDLVSWVSLLATFSILQASIGRMGTLMKRSMTEMADLIAHPDMANGLSFAGRLIRDGFVAVAPLMLAFAGVALVSHFAQVRFVLAFKSLKPNFKKMDPIQGTKRLFSAQSMFMAAKQAVVATILAYVGYRTLYSTMMGITQNGPYAVTEVVRITVVAVVNFIKQAAFAGLIIGIIDYAYQKRKMGKNLKMTKEEVKQESKNQEGNAEVKGKLRQKQRAMSRNRMMSQIKNADVVVVNPVHIAVALSYDPVRGAPKVVAKGAGFVAEKIREKADENKIAIVQDIPLARTLHRVCEVDDEIPGEMFEAVAKLLAFVFSLRKVGRASGEHRMPGSPDMAEADRLEGIEKARAAKEAAAEAAKQPALAR